MKKSALRTSAIFLLLMLTAPLIVHGKQQLEAYNGNNKSFTLSDLKEKEHSLSDYHGKVVLVNFWASWCPPCIHEMPALKRLKQSFANRPFEILAINVGEKKYKVRKFSKTIKLDLPVLLDTNSQTFNDWGAKTLPTSFLIDVDGKIHYQVLGNPGWELDENVKIIESLLP